MQNNQIDNDPDNLIDPEDTSFSDETIIRAFNPNEIEIETPPYTVGYLIDRLAYDEINLNTEFQRENNLWSIKMQSRLIESILLGLPLPAFYFDTQNTQWDIVDGLQRCCSIYNFCVKKDFALTGLEFLEHKDGVLYLEGKTFDDLDRTLQRNIITRPITVNLIKKADKRVRFILFKRLNTSGLELTPAEIRNAVYYGKSSEIIKKLAQSEFFKKITEGKIPAKRMQDRDFVSRFAAFYLVDYTKFEPNLDDFINKGLDLLKSIDEQTIINDFNRALALAYEVFETDAFRKRVTKDAIRGRLNKAYFEVITVTFSKLNESEQQKLIANKTLLKNNLVILMNSPRYSNSLSGGTGTKDSVFIRFSWFQHILNKSLLGISIKISHDNKIEDSEL